MLLGFFFFVNPEISKAYYDELDIVDEELDANIAVDDSPMLNLATSDWLVVPMSERGYEHKYCMLERNKVKRWRKKIATQNFEGV